ncbi:hypothetical protein L484_017198 [Morus notabilis]|uniref:Uncharacterized protein n=1 Tax=Morus notabilis TaxID=981085 RepID=W9QVF6_9ROSA|nr:hypothetical protein L484_017198 [Morus notabilis]
MVMGLDYLQPTDSGVKFGLSSLDNRRDENRPVQVNLLPHPRPLLVLLNVALADSVKSRSSSGLNDITIVIMTLSNCNDVGARPTSRWQGNDNVDMGI